MTDPVPLLTTHPLTPDGWPDLEAVFGAKGLRGAIEFAKARSAPALEAYPIDKAVPGADAWLWNGAMSMYRKAGFAEVARRRPERPVVRLAFTGDAASQAGPGRTAPA